MNVEEWLTAAKQKLKNSSVPTAQLDAELILAHHLKKDRSWLHAHPDYNPTRRLLVGLEAAVERRARHEPIAYILGKQEFYGREFVVSPDTLTPRPETETLVEMVLKFANEESIQEIHDIGTGSGCIAITLALELNSKTKIAACDVSQKALAIARQNAKRFGAQVGFYRDNISKEEKHRWQTSQCIVANLPYVPENFNINLAASHEPAFAIFGGKDGLDYYRYLFAQLKYGVQHVFTESMPPQHESLRAIAAKNGFALHKTQDFIQHFTRAN